jgi:hypothetical protein
MKKNKINSKNTLKNSNENGILINMGSKPPTQEKKKIKDKKIRKNKQTKDKLLYRKISLSLSSSSL